MNKKLSPERQKILDALGCALDLPSFVQSVSCPKCPYYQKPDCHEALYKEIERWAKKLEVSEDG